MHIDLNSCFATIEQQANPLIRGKAVVVVAYNSPGGCIVAPSIEAKKNGIKVGMRVFEAKKIDPKVIVLTPDPDKYRDVNFKLRKIISKYSADFGAQSIDEFSVSLENHLVDKNPIKVAQEIKKRIKNEIGEAITVSIGISTNKYLAKLASNLKKPDGLSTIDKNNYLNIYKGLKLTDLPWIKTRNTARLNSVGIFSVVDFYKSDTRKLKSAFLSVLAHYWYLRLKGWEIDNHSFSRKSFGNSYALPNPTSDLSKLAPLLAKLVEKMSFRLRRSGYTAQGLGVFLRFKDGNVWHQTKKTFKNLFESREIYKSFFQILVFAKIAKPVAEISIVSFNLNPKRNLQLEMFEDREKKEKLAEAVDKINENWGSFCLFPARMIGTENKIIDRIAFGGMEELENLSTSTDPNSAPNSF